MIHKHLHKMNRKCCINIMDIHQGAKKCIHLGSHPEICLSGGKMRGVCVPVLFFLFIYFFLSLSRCPFCFSFCFNKKDRSKQCERSPSETGLYCHSFLNWVIVPPSEGLKHTLTDRQIDRHASLGAGSNLAGKLERPVMAVGSAVGFIYFCTF